MSERQYLSIGKDYTAEEFIELVQQKDNSVQEIQAMLNFFNGTKNKYPTDHRQLIRAIIYEELTRAKDEAGDLDLPRAAMKRILVNASSKFGLDECQSSEEIGKQLEKLKEEIKSKITKPAQDWDGYKKLARSFYKKFEEKDKEQTALGF